MNFQISLVFPSHALVRDKEAEEAILLWNRDRKSREELVLSGTLSWARTTFEDDFSAMANQLLYRGSVPRYNFDRRRDKEVVKAALLSLLHFLQNAFRIQEEIDDCPTGTTTMSPEHKS